MTVTKEFCDRCGKEVKNEALEMKLFPIILKEPKAYLRFRSKIDWSETTKMICEDCLRELIEWWENK